jgi:catechol 2,3-dioxygenase-like lactoylglutathione lyase family enzyme
MFSHIIVGTRDLRRAEAFYDAVLPLIGLKRRQVIPDGGPESACWISPNRALPRFYVSMPFNGQPATVANGSMVAFLAPTPDAVDRAYRAALAAGGTDEGPPGERLHYGAGYYGAYIRDPDGNKVHIVHRGDMPGAAAT